MNGNDIIQRLFGDITKNKEIFEAPSIYNEKDFESYLSSRIDAYYGFLKTNDFSKFLNELYKYNLGITSSKDELKLLNRIYAFSGVLKRGVKNYLNGKPNKFYESFASSLDKLLDFNTNIFISELSVDKNYYRVRSSKVPLLDTKDLFHIPFESRHLCSTQRYSIPGVPSIYLGSSTEVCFRELEIDNSTVEQCYISLFQLNESINVLEILTVQNFIEKMESAESFLDKYNLLLKFVMLFPLYLSCTIKVRINSGFKPEYIVSQFLLEYVTTLEDSEKKIDGIKFPSTKWISPQSGHNVVLPIIASDVSGYCSYLKTILKVSKPVVSGDFKEVRKSKNIVEINFKALDEKISLQDARLLV